MSGVNKVLLIGNLGADPEVKYTPGGQAVCELRIATNETWNDKNGQKQDRTEWHRVVVWGKRGEVCGKFLAKGRSVYVEGKLRTRSWEDKDGNKRYTTEIVAHDVQFLGGRDGGGNSGGGQRQERSQGGDDYGYGYGDYQAGPAMGEEDDIPF